MPAISGGTNACVVVLLGSGASRTMLTTPPAAPASTVGRARIAAGAMARDVPSTATALAAAIAAKGTRAIGRGEQMARQQLAALDRQAVGAIRLVDLLRQWLHHFEAEQEQHECGADQGRRRAADHHRLENAGHCGEGGHAHESSERGSGPRWRCRAAGSDA